MSACRLACSLFICVLGTFTSIHAAACCTSREPQCPSFANFIFEEAIDYRCQSYQSSPNDSELQYCSYNNMAQKVEAATSPVSDSAGITQKELRILCLGDSLTSGYMMSRTESFPYGETMQFELAKMLATTPAKLRVRISGLPGNPQIFAPDHQERVSYLCLYR